MNKELVSIIMPTYNASKYVACSIDSILSQTYKNIELLITDDCSTDGTQDILKEYALKDARIKVFLQKTNMGSGYARNNSIKESKGRYIAFCDSDDRWFPDKLEKQISFMKKKNCCFSFSSYIVCNEQGVNKGIVIAPSEVSLKDTMKDDKIGFLTAVYDTEKCGKLYMPTLRKRQDWAYVLMILQRCHKAYSLKEPLAYYRLRSNSISANKFSLVKYNAKVYNTVFGFSKMHSYCYLFLHFIPNYTLKRIRNQINNVRHKKIYKNT